MAGVTYKCPSCGAYLAFDPDTQKWRCDFCSAEFDEKTLLAKADEYQQQAEQEAAQAKPSAGDGAGTQVVYHCPSCGSEIMTDETTVATHCYYCHNPVVLQGKLTADMRPELVLPFSVSREKAIDQFLQWVQKKRFVPKGFFSRDQITEMQGVYYPHFVTECTMDATYEGEGLDTSVADVGDYIVTTTKHYAIHRRGTIDFRNVMRPALQSADRKLSDGIHPFPLEDYKDFSGAYLSGFLAERRDLTEQQATADVESELQGYVAPMLTRSVHFTSYSGRGSGQITNQKSRYILLPTWVLTYKGKGKDPYFYAMNGRTGKVCGKLPIDQGRLTGFCAGIGAAVALVLCFLLYFV